MDSLSDLRSAVQSDLTVDSNSPFFPPATIDLALNRAYRKIAGLFPWPDLQDAQKTSTVSGQFYYDYPDNWRPNTIWKLRVDGVRYGMDPDGSPTAFPDFLLFLENSPSTSDKRWANRKRSYLFFPTPTASGVNNIEIWGQKVVTKMVADNDVSIFSFSMPEVNEALVLEAVAILKNKGELQQLLRRSYISGSELLSLEARTIVMSAWAKVKEDNSKYEKEQPYFQVPDFFGRNSSIGDSDGEIGDF